MKRLIDWEQTSDGKSALHQTKVHYIRKNNLILKKIAFSKMTDVSLISAEFDNILLVFESLLSVFFDNGEDMEFMGTYCLSFPDDDENTRPSLCLRHSRWNKENDYEQFNQAKNKEVYLRSEKQLVSKIIFIDSLASSELHRLMDKFLADYGSNLRFNQTTRHNNVWHEIRYKAVGFGICYDVSYHPAVLENIQLETWTEKWRDVFVQLANNKGVIPDNGCQISYNLTLIELLARLRF